MNPSIETALDRQLGHKRVRALHAPQLEPVVPSEQQKLILDRFDMSLGTGLGKLAGRVFRIGHVGWFNDLMLAGTLSGVEMGLHEAGVPHKSGGIVAALNVLKSGSQREELAPHLQSQSG